MGTVGGGLFRPTSYTDVLLRGMVKCKREEANTIDEELEKPATVDLIRINCGGDVTRKVKKIPPANEMICSRVYDRSYDIHSNT